VTTVTTVLTATSVVANSYSTEIRATNAPNKVLLSKSFNILSTYR